MRLHLDPCAQSGALQMKKDNVGHFWRGLMRPEGAQGRAAQAAQEKAERSGFVHA